MKIIYSCTNTNDNIIISGSERNPLRLLLSFYDNSDFYVYYVSDYDRQAFLNKIEKVSVLDEALHVDHLRRIESDAEFDYYMNWIHNNYNYDGYHYNDKISSHSKGGSVLVDLDGNTLLHGDGE